MNNFISMSNLSKKKQINFKEISIMKQTFLALILIVLTFVVFAIANLQAQTFSASKDDIILTILPVEIRGSENIAYTDDTNISAEILQKKFGGLFSNLRQEGVRTIRMSYEDFLKRYYADNKSIDDMSEKKQGEPTLLVDNYIFESCIYIYSDSSVKFVATIIDFKTSEEVAYIASKPLYEAEHQILIDTAEKLVKELSSNFTSFLKQKR